MSRFFEVNVEEEVETGKGSIKVVKSTYLVDAESVTEAELRLIKDFRKAGYSNEFNVAGAKKSKIAGVIFVDEDQKQDVNKESNNLVKDQSSKEESID